MAKRVAITTAVPAGTEVSAARNAALIQAAQQIGIHIVEETLLPTIEVDPPVNDHTVDRVLTTWWTIA